MTEDDGEIPSSSAIEDGVEHALSERDDGDDGNESNDDNNKDDSVSSTSSALDNNLPWWKFGGDETSQGYNLMGLARAPILLSSVFLSTTILWLAAGEAGCLDEEDEIIVECDGTVHGRKPATFLTMIAIIAGLLSAFFMPVVGAMVDCTDHRKALAIGSSVILVVLTASQMALNEDTWLFFSFVQAFSIFVFQVQAITWFAYQPDMLHRLGEKRHGSYNATFVVCMSMAMLIYLFLCGAATMALGLDGKNVEISRFAQGLAFVWVLPCYFFCFRLLPKAPKKRETFNGRSLIAEGFCRVYRTAREMNVKYKHGLRWFFLATALGDAGMQGYLLGSIIFLGSLDVVNTSNIGIAFFIIVLSSIAGAIAVKKVVQRLKPISAWQSCMMLVSVSTFVFLPLIQNGYTFLALVWLVLIGFFMGWYHVLQQIFLANAVPKEQEAEMSGFFVYCTLILTWLPGLIIGALIEMGKPESYAIIAVTCFFVLSALTLAFTGTWEQILEEGRQADEESKSLKQKDCDDELNTTSGQDVQPNDDEL